ncbi:hypothetical protein [Brachybacterium sp. Z12]|uniref:hypothetical protein n=1 Tax=Brachybacterium sp. Z12 TaxID=2759167 RepID=UPI00223C3875|nr:hypothetical protein [Brachybacterium sp. Z12]
MRSFLSGLSGRHQPQRHPLLDGLRGQTIIHTRVASRGTWTVTARGWVLQSRIQQLGGPALDEDPSSAVGLRDPRLVGATIRDAEMLGDGHLTLTLQNPQGPLWLSTVPRWQLEGPRGALLHVAAKGSSPIARPGLRCMPRPSSSPRTPPPPAAGSRSACSRWGATSGCIRGTW